MQNLFIRTLLTFAIAAMFCNVRDVHGQNLGILRGAVKLNDKPLAGVMVIVRSPAGQKSSLTNSTGQYEISNLSSGTYLLTVANTPYVISDGIGGSFTQIEIKGSGVKIADIPLKEGAVLTGCVEYASKKPVIEREVIYENSSLALNGFSLSSFRQTAVTNDLGCFRLYGLPSGKYRVGVGKPLNGLSTDLSPPFTAIYYPGVQRQSDAQLVEITAGNELDLGPLVLKNQATTGIVRGSFINSASGDRVPNLSFELVRYDENGIASISRLKGDEAGEFYLENQAPGRYRIQPALSSGQINLFTFKSTSFDLSETNDNEIVVSCTSVTAAIRGEVRINNDISATNKDCSIALKEGDGLGAGGDVHRINLNRGNFDLSGLPRGVYTLVVMPLRTSVQYAHAQVGPQTERGSLGPIGLVRIDLTAADQLVKVFLTEVAEPKP